MLVLACGRRSGVVGVAGGVGVLRVVAAVTLGGRRWGRGVRKTPWPRELTNGRRACTFAPPCAGRCETGPAVLLAPLPSTVLYSLSLSLPSLLPLLPLLPSLLRRRRVGVASALCTATWVAAAVTTCASAAAGG